MKDMFDRASAGVGEDKAVALKLLLIKYRGVVESREGYGGSKWESTVRVF